MGEEEEEKNLFRRNVTAAGWSSELARTNSESASALTAADVFKDFSHLDAYAPPVPSATWTDEKHNSYIRSLEASFIDQLHRSINLCSAPPKIKCRPYSPDESQFECHTSSRRFTVLRNGRWQKISKRNELSSESTADSHFVGETPEVSGSPGVAETHCGKECNYLLRALSSQETCRGNSVAYLARKSGKHPAFGLIHEDSVGGAIEVSDQNFTHEDVGEKSNYVAAAKRLKAVDVVASINDQVVPMGMPDAQNLPNAGQDAFARDHWKQPAIPSGNPD